MKIAIVLCVILAFGISKSTCEQLYDGYKLYRVSFDPFDLEKSELVSEIVNTIDGIDIWQFSTALGIADIFTPPDAEMKLLEALKKNKIDYSLLNDDVGGLIQNTKVV